MSFGSPKIPKPEKVQPLPAPPTPASNPAILAAGNNARSMVSGIGSTIATSSQGVTAPASTGFKTLLGQ